MSLPSWRGLAGDAQRGLDTVDAWARSPALASLVEAFGGAVGQRSGRELFAFLDGFSGETWDFRSGRERNLSRAVSLTAEQESLVRATAPALGLAGRERPPLPHYDTIIMTGGMVRAGIVKPRFVAELLASGITTDNVVFLGAFRPFAGDEAELARALGVSGDDEFDAMASGLERAFGPLGAAEVHRGSVGGDPGTSGDAPHPFAAWRTDRWHSRGVSFSVQAAPSSNPARGRANTADTLHFWAEHRAATERSVLVVTTPIYVPHQAAAAVEVLGVGHGLVVDTVGVSATASDLGALSQQFLPQHHLQELRSAIRSLRSLRAALEGHPA